MRTEVRNRIEMLGKEVAAELTATLPAHRRWVCVLPVAAPHPNRPTPAPPGRYRVATFEVLMVKIDAAQSLGEGDLEMQDIRWADSLDAVEAALAALGVDSDALTEPWKCDYPL